MIRVQWNKIPGHELWLVLMEFWAFWLNSKCKKLLIMVLDVANICEKDEERKKTRSSFNIVRCDNRNLYFRLYEMLIYKNQSDPSVQIFTDIEKL